MFFRPCYYSNGKKINFSLILLAWLTIGSINVIFYYYRGTVGVYKQKATYESLYFQLHNTVNNLGKWKKIRSTFSEVDLKNAKQLTSSEAKIIDTESTISKINKLGTWLLKSTQHCPFGVPPDSFTLLSPINQYNIIVKEAPRIWCGTFGYMFLFFCTANNITCRYVEIMNDPEHHVINECYIPELNQWVLVDLTYNILYAQNDTGRYLNIIDVENLSYEGKKDSITLFSYMNDSLIKKIYTISQTLWKQYLSHNKGIFFYYTTDLKKVYSLKDKIVRYLLPVSWYEVYSEKNLSNIWFYLRLSLLFIWILLSFLIVIYIET